MLLIKKFIKDCIPYGEKKNRQWPQVFSILIVSLGSFSFGTLFAWTSPSIPILTSDESPIGKITLEEASYFAVIPPIALAISAPLVAYVIDAYGRKKTIMFMTFPQLVAWLLIAFANHTYIIYVSRFLSGVADSIYFCAIPVYIGEIAEPHVRGSWGNLLTITTYLGYFMVNLIGAYCSIRTTALIFGTLPVLHMVLMIFLPESPYFCLMKNNVKEARSSLKTLRWRKNVDEEFASLTEAVERQLSEPRTLKDVFTIRTNRKALMICTVMRAIQQFSGISAFAAYTHYMFEEAGGHLSASTSSIIYDGVLTLAITGFAFVVDKFGRKPLMIFSCAGCGIILTLVGTYFYIDQATSLSTAKLAWIPLLGMLIYLILSSSGLGILPTLMLSELFSASIKGKALCIANICFSAYLLSSSKVFQVTSEKFGMYVPFYLFSACCFLGLIFSYFFVPETKGKTLEEIQQILKGKASDREILTTHC